MQKKNQFEENSKYTLYLSITAFVILFIYYFSPVLLQNKIFVTNDVSYGLAYFSANTLSFFSTWINDFFLGRELSAPLNIEHIIGILFGVNGYLSFGFISSIIFTFIASIYLFRTLGFSYLVSSIIALWFTFLPAHVSYLRVGHTGKLYLVPFFILTFAFFHQFIQSKKITKILFFGFFFTITLSLSFLTGAIQTALYYAILLPCYLIFIFVLEKKNKQEAIFFLNYKKLILFLFLIIFAIVLSFPSLKDYLPKKSDAQPLIAEINSQQNKKKENSKEQKWNWATQWSNHPYEAIELIAPGFFGFLSGDQEAPYWGKIGQDINWGSQKRGIRNLSLAASYLGIFIFIFAIFGIFFSNNKLRWFWAGASLFCLLLAFGRYFPLFSIFYKILPMMDKMRNPNKFYHVFFFCFTILSSYGLNSFIQIFMEQKKNIEEKIFSKKKKWFLGINFSLIGLLFLIIIIVFFVEDSLKQYLITNQYQQVHQTILSNIYFSLIKGIFFYIIALAPFYLLFYKKDKFTQKYLIHLAVYLIFFSMIDLASVNQKFFTFQEKPFGNKSLETVKRNADPVLKSILKLQDQQMAHRIGFLGRNSYSEYIHYTYGPIFKINYFNPIAAREIPENVDFMYRKFSTMPFFYNVLAVNYFLTAEPQLENYPNFNVEYVSSFSYGNKQSVLLYKNKDALPYIFLANSSEILTNKNQFEKLNSAEFLVGKKVFVEDEKNLIKKENLSVQTIENEKTNNYFLPDDNSVKINKIENEKIELKIYNKTDSILVLANAYSQNWKMKIDDKFYSPFRINSLFNGYRIPRIEQETKVFLVFQKSYGYFFISLFSYLAFLILMIFAVVDNFFLKKKIIIKKS